MSAATKQVLRFEVDHLHMIKDLTQEETIDCDFCETTSLAILTTSRQAVAAREMYDTLRRAPSFDKGLLNDVHLHTGDDAPYRTGVVWSRPKDIFRCQQHGSPPTKQREID